MFSLPGHENGCTQTPSSNTVPLLQKHLASQDEFLQLVTPLIWSHVMSRPHDWYFIPDKQSVEQPATYKFMWSVL